MSRAGKIARRSFLIGSAAIAGGVAFGVYAVRTPHDNPLAAGLGAEEATFNPWVRISPERITLITPHADLGQGVMHMQATLIAEEMDLDLGQFETAFGPPAPAYYNRALADEAASYLAAITPLSRDTLGGTLGGALKLAGQQVTGGSSAVPDSFDKLREAGAVARETLKAAAAAETGIPVTELTTRAGAVVLPDGTELPYTSLAARAATIEPVTDVTLRDPSEWRLIGTPMQRSDIIAKSTGQQRYGIDLQMEGMVHAAVRLSPRRSALISHDATAARKMRGVLDVVEITDGIAVLADNTWRAFQAAQAIRAEWAPAAYPAEQEAHWTEVAESLENADRRNLTWRDDGDVAAALAGGAPIEAEYRAPYVAHQPLEPLNAIVRVTDDRVEVWTAHQMPRVVQAAVAGITGHDPDQVVFHNQHSGGSFGHRLEVDFVRQAAEIANTRRGTPVKLTYSREEDFAQDFPRPLAMARGRGTVAEGRVTALDMHVAAPEVIVSQLGRLGLPAFAARPETQIAAGIWNAPYGIADFRVQDYAVPGLAPTSSWRSVGASTGGFFLESCLDELIHAAGADPMEERIRLCTDPVARACLEAVAEMSGWGGEMGANRGRGVALVQSFGVPVAEVVEVTMTGDGLRLDRVLVAADVGTVIDPVNIENQIQGAVVWGLGHAINSEITYADGRAEQQNYYDAEGLRLRQCPEIVVRALENGPAIRGVGEPPVPPAAPALANAIFAATGERLREMPFHRFMEFV